MIVPKRILRTKVFFEEKDLVDFVNKCGIKQEEIQTITESLRIFYWENGSEVIEDMEDACQK